MAVDTLPQLLHLLPYGILCTGTLLSLLLSLFYAKQENKFIFSLLTALTVAGASIALLFVKGDHVIENSFLLVDHLGFGFAQVILLLLLLLVPVFVTESSSLDEKPSMVYGLCLLSACGGLLMVYANHLLILFVGLELLSIPLYILTALGHMGRKSSEAAFKYFLLGSISSALFVYGFALLWGTTGVATISEIREIFKGTTATSQGLLYLAFALMATGIAFKIGLAPFQMWVPDVYEGSPSVVIAWAAGAVKAASLAVALRLLGQPISAHWPTVLSGIAILSMLWGSFGALYQKNVKRMLGYSAIAHGGYACVALVCAAQGATTEACAALTFYILVYGLANLTSFVILSCEEKRMQLTISDLNGLAERRPFFGLALAISLLSLAGLPPLGGFIGKFNIFILAIEKKHFGLAFVGMATSVISLFYYLRLIVAAYMEKPSHEGRLKLKWSTSYALGVTITLTLLLGILPGYAIDFFLKGGQ